MTQQNTVRWMAGAAVAAVILGGASLAVTHAQQAAPRRAPAPAAGRMAGQGPVARLRLGLAQLGLSKEQQEHVKAILQSHKADLQGLAKHAAQARRAVRDAVAAGESEQAIRDKSSALAQVQADAAVFSAKIRSEVVAVLTPEQQAKAKQLRLKALERIERVIEQRKKDLGF